ncbi:MAG: VOC family protein [Candidatus Eisenbacteria bacterium]
MSSYDGEFLWYDLMTKDVEGATAFYEEVIGWDTEAWNQGPMSYVMWQLGGAGIGGVMPLPTEAQQAGAPSHWLAYVGTSDLAASFQKMQSLGGTIYVPPMEIQDVGEIAVFGDPNGGVLAMFQPRSEAPPILQGPGRFSWHEHLSTELDSSVSFYASLFGWQKHDAMDMGPMGTYQLYGQPNRSLGGMMTKPDGIPGPSFWLYYINVADMEATLAKVRSNGGMVMNGPMEVPGGDLVAQCMDPQGAAFALHQVGAQS